MLILALDLAKRTGFAIGRAGETPRVGAKVLASKEEPVEAGAQELGRFLRDAFVLEKPDMIVVEHWLHPKANRSGDAVIWQMLLHGAVHGVLGCYRDVRFESPTPTEVRNHFCGRASAEARSRAPSSWRAKKAARDATKAMVIDRAIALGYLPKTRRDDDIADACALFDWASVRVGRAPPRSLVLFGEAPLDDMTLGGTL